MENTKLFKLEMFKDLQKFGETDFYLRYSASVERYDVLDGTHDEYNAILSFPSRAETEIQELFDAFYKGYKHGEDRGEHKGRTELQHEMRLLLNL